MKFQNALWPSQVDLLWPPLTFECLYPTVTFQYLLYNMLLRNKVINWKQDRNGRCTPTSLPFVPLLLKCSILVVYSNLFINFTFKSNIPHTFASTAFDEVCVKIQFWKWLLFQCHNYHWYISLVSVRSLSQVFVRDKYCFLDIYDNH